jgi:hypothetical protein
MLQPERRAPEVPTDHATDLHRTTRQSPSPRARIDRVAHDHQHDHHQQLHHL